MNSEKYLLRLRLNVTRDQQSQQAIYSLGGQIHIQNKKQTNQELKYGLHLNRTQFALNTLSHFSF